MKTLSLAHQNKKWTSGMNFEFDPKKTNCLNCNSEKIFDYFIDFNGINIAKCKDCSLQFMNPQYTDAYLDDYYTNYTENEDFDYWNEAAVYGHGFYLSLVEKYIKPGKLLDIGCGNGHLMEAGIKRGWEVQGYDVAEQSVEAVAKRLNVPVYHGDFFQCDPGKDLDVISMHQVLEHLRDPNSYLEKVHALLKKDGYLFIAVPNIKSFSNHLKHVQEKLGIRKKGIGKYYDTSHHLTYFVPKTLKSLLKKHGFEVVYQRNCHKVRPGQSKFKRFIKRNITEHTLAQSAFLFIAKKV
jgi:2-polyprenyl-3-methyl-5-hydroxy-6-metoxy-1,4-benzoquinol methylase